MTHRVLIVDDDPETRYLFRSSIKTINGNIEIIDVPSGEEAFFEFSIRSFDLLIADMRLAGMTGLELMWTLKGKYPDMRVILVTGAEAAITREKVANAGADYYFIKPIEIDSFIDAVERCLGIKEAPPKKKPVKQEKQNSSEYHLSKYLIKLRSNLDAFAVVLLNDRGDILAQAGDIPPTAGESALVQSLMISFSTGIKISRLLGAKTPENLSCYSGAKLTLFFAHVGLNYALLIALKTSDVDAKMAVVIKMIRQALTDIQDLLSGFVIEPTAEDEFDEMPLPIDLPDDEDSEGDEDLNRFLASKDVDTMVGDEVEAFWQSLTSETSNAEISNPDSITYEQARKLGLAPKDEE